jgi:hypothetical protein
VPVTGRGEIFFQMRLEMGDRDVHGR